MTLVSDVIGEVSDVIGEVSDVIGGINDIIVEGLVRHSRGVSNGIIEGLVTA